MKNEIVEGLRELITCYDAFHLNSPMAQEIEMWRKRYLLNEQVQKSAKEGDTVWLTFLYTPCSDIISKGPDQCLEICKGNKCPEK